MTPAGKPPEDAGQSVGSDPPPGAGVPPAEFLDELAAAFRRLRPQGTDRWNFAAAFALLEQRYGEGAAPWTPAGAPPPPGGDQPVDPAPGAARRPLRRAADPVIARVQPWVEFHAAAAAVEAANEATDRALARELGRVEEGFGATLEAFRFLSARVEALEDAAGRRAEPVVAPAWLVPAPVLEPWAGPVTEWLRADAAQSRPGAVLHGECGDGALAAALGTVGLAVEGCEPRGSLAWATAERGVPVHLGEMAAHLAGRPPGALGGLVLSGLVDRLAIEDLVAVVGSAVRALAPGGRIVIVGTRPGVPASGPDAVARDLLPGRPLHPETWAVLLQRGGFTDVAPLAGDPAAGDTHALGARRAR